MDNLKLFTGNANPELAQHIADYLNLPVSKAQISKFSNGECSVLIDDSVRNCDVFVVQPTCSPNMNDNLMELLIMVDAFKRASASSINAVIPYFGYARQNSKERSRVPITCKLVANMLEAAGVNRIITMDLNASQISGFFDVPVDNLYCSSLMVKYINKRIQTPKVVVSPGPEGVKRAVVIADLLDCPLAFLHRQTNHESGKVEMVMVGEVQDHVAIIIGDIADTCSTLELASRTLLNKGATEVFACLSHGIFSGEAVKKINSCGLTELLVTNSIPMSAEAKACPKIKAVSCAHMFAEVIRRTYFGESISSSPRVAFL